MANLTMIGQALGELGIPKLMIRCGDELGASFINDVVQDKRDYDCAVRRMTSNGEVFWALSRLAELARGLETCFGQTGREGGT